MNESNNRLIVIGGGAAGFFCAVNAAATNKQLKVYVLEKTGKLLSKVKVSGGGRCNVTHACFDVVELAKSYPRGYHFVKKSFHHFNTTDTVEWFRKRGVELKTEADGRMFPTTDSSDTIISCLLKEATEHKIEILMNASVDSVEKRGDLFSVVLQDGRALEAKYVCIACGGFPKTPQFEFIRRLGHTIALPVPSLFTFNLPGHGIRELMGVSVNPVTIKIASSKYEQSGPVLITHWGLSGPAVLKLSAWAAVHLAKVNYNFVIQVNWLHSVSQHALQQQWPDLRNLHSNQQIGNKNPFGLPARLWLFLLRQSGIAEQTKWSELGAKPQNLLMKNLTDYTLTVRGKTTFKEEFVTAGGVSLSSINASTMESKIVANLFFAGEVMDVDGVTGGFNFQHAWTSGWLAAKNIAGRGEGYDEQDMF